MESLIEKVNSQCHVFFGIEGTKLFVQIATRENEIAYAAETSIAVDPSASYLAEKVYDLFPDSFKKSGIKAPKQYFEWDGQKVFNSGEKTIIDCKTVKDIFPKFGAFIFSFLAENGME
ncbi:hypothetical protein KKC17_00295 [Patescibacteria group bacterium]|nr:hypothetical protein [Patescibacteria group bacterium]